MSRQNARLQISSFIALMLVGFSFLEAGAASQRPTVEASAPSPEVPQGFYMVAQAHHFSVIRSFGVNSCILLTLFDPATQTGVLAHIGTSTDVPASLDRLVEAIAALGIPKARLQARLVGGLKDWSDQLAEDLVASLRKQRIQLVESDVLAPSGGFKPNSSELIKPGALRKITHNYEFNLTTGQISFYTGFVSDPSNPDYTKMLPVDGILIPNSRSL